MSKIKSLAELLGEDINKMILSVDEVKDADHTAFVKMYLDNIEVYPTLLPKHWEPKHEYVELCKGLGFNYMERVVRKSDARKHIRDGWRETKLSKLSHSLMCKKWVNAIIAMENS
ncbi:hypothetical protein ZZ1p0047 [Acinetobacter phage ZZ1]|mgnify:CR=1 FL=1|jgi:hypothetical protein|uniref:Uncharacterized protein n=3 Tax=Caudoviricetes TaxID=2731619 RepID=A0A410T5P8_9CAUD|nr:hypothetical protein ZZ1p0047 [Acinetobacter phage ZZ1]AFL47579.1 hypothetical protein ZZ1p0047 [Acinetobacter phage ZZ1]QAU04082.1 hypothetical protein Henu6_gp102 [Acinetobacter phage Henu6]